MWPRQTTGKTAFVTGSNTGLGYFAAKALAKRGATVVLLCRSVEKAEAAKREMGAELGDDGEPLVGHATHDVSRALVEGAFV